MSLYTEYYHVIRGEFNKNKLATAKVIFSRFFLKKLYENYFNVIGLI
jgi:hypothetical protein